MTNGAFVEAPNARAAALFYGAATDGNMQLGAVVYEQDGQPYHGDMAWLAWCFRLAAPTEQEIEEIKADLARCRFVRERRAKP